MNDLSIFDGMKKINVIEKIIAQKNNVTVTLTRLDNCFIRWVSVKNEAKKYALSDYKKAVKQLKDNNFTLNTYKIS